MLSRFFTHFNILFSSLLLLLVSMVIMVDSSMTLRSSAVVPPYCRSMWSSDGLAGVFCRLSLSGGFDVPWNGFRRTSLRKCSLEKNRSSIRASAKRLGPGSDPRKPSGKLQYHPFEDIAKSVPLSGGDALLTSEETARTIIEVNSKATLMFSSLLNNDLHENLLWPELPYVTDEHGNIYFQVKDGEDTMQALTSENSFVQVFIGIETMEMISEMELSGPAEIDFGIDEIDEDNDIDDDDGEEDENDEDGDDDDDFDADWVAVLDDEDGEEDEDEALGDWAKLETMRSSHPMYFAKKISDVVSDVPVDWMEQPPASLAIQGAIRPAFIEEHSVIQKHLSNQQSSDVDSDEGVETVGDDSEDPVKINGHRHESESVNNSSTAGDGLDRDEISSSGTVFYKLEMIKIQLFSSHGHQTTVEVEDFMKAQPDAIAHSAAKIMSRLKAGGEKITQALKSLCWRQKAMQVEEAVVIGVDSLGFDMRVCSGTQVQTLRFGFDARATSEYGAERQLNDLLFPRVQHKPHKLKQTHQNEC